MPGSPAAADTKAFSASRRAPFSPSIFGTVGPCRSASRTPTLLPPAASAAARLTVTRLLPTPPLPLMTAILCLMPAIRSVSRLCSSTRLTKASASSALLASSTLAIL